MSRKILFLCFLLCSGSQCAVAMSVDEAYRAIPHQKTDFNRSEAHMRSDEATYLDSFFTLINAGIVAKVQALQWLSSGGATGSPYIRYRATVDAILADFNRLTIPADLHDVQKQIVSAMQLHSEYFAEWAERSDLGERFHFDGADKRIVGSSHLLIQSYNRLMQLYPDASSNNRQAFYDHLCALDFI